MSTSAASSTPATSPPPSEVLPPDHLDGDDMTMEELEREVELSMTAMMEQPEQTLPTLPAHMPAAKKEEPAPSASRTTGGGVSGNLARALCGGGGSSRPPNWLPRS